MARFVDLIGNAESEIAAQVGVTEQRVQSIVAELVEGGYLTRIREGRWATMSTEPPVAVVAPDLPGRFDLGDRAQPGGSVML
jgi:hypothetical protein